MTDLDLTIAGRSYRVACAPGEEAHITRLGQMIDARLAGASGLAGQSETRALLYAALLLADELHELGQAGPVAADPVPFETLADRLESLATRLEDLAPST